MSNLNFNAKNIVDELDCIALDAMGANQNTHILISCPETTEYLDTNSHIELKKLYESAAKIEQEPLPPMSHKIDVYIDDDCIQHKDNAQQPIYTLNHVADLSVVDWNLIHRIIGIYDTGKIVIKKEQVDD